MFQPSKTSETKTIAYRVFQPFKLKYLPKTPIEPNFDVFSNPPLWCLYTEPVFLNCECGFTLSQYEELKILLGGKYNDICNEVMHQRFYREEIDVVF